ncbi:MAG TPA: hypothetical protein VIC84_08685 [Blastocatellia bacterium]|jgi:hypothetical protein
MPGYLLDEGATVLCVHGGRAQPTAPNQRVKAGGKKIVTQREPYSVSGCSFNVSGAPSPCITARWWAAATRVRAGGQFVLLEDSQATCDPNQTPVKITATQTRVKGK